jgi:hypothetical protein
MVGIIWSQHENEPKIVTGKNADGVTGAVQIDVGHVAIDALSRGPGAGGLTLGIVDSPKIGGEKRGDPRLKQAYP